MLTKPLILALGGLGLLLGHEFTYKLYSVTSTQTQNTILEKTGHAWYGHMQPLIIALLVLTFASLIFSKKNVSFKQLLLFQIAAFTTLEISERLVYGGTFTNIAVILAIGFILQSIVAGILYFASSLVFTLKSKLNHNTLLHVYHFNFKTSHIFTQTHITKNLLKNIVISRAPPSPIVYNVNN